MRLPQLSFEDSQRGRTHNYPEPLFQVLTASFWIFISLISSQNVPCCNVYPSRSIIVHFSEESGFIFSVAFCYVGEDSNKILPLPVCIGLESLLHIICASSLWHSAEVQNWTRWSRCSLTRPEKGGTFISLYLLAMLLPIHHSTCLDFLCLKDTLQNHICLVV